MERRHFFKLLPALLITPSVVKEKELIPIWVFKGLEWKKIEWMDVKKGDFLRTEIDGEYRYHNAQSDAYLYKGIPAFVGRPGKIADIS